MSTAQPRPSRRTLLACGVLMLLLVGSGSQIGADAPEPTDATAAGAGTEQSDDPEPGADPFDGRSADEGGGGEHEPPPDLQTQAPAGSQDQDHLADRDGAPAGDDVRPSADLQPEPLAQQVTLHEPDLVVRSPQALAPDAGDVSGVTHRTVVGELTATTADRDGQQRELDLLAVEGESFRPLTPEVTAQAPAVWQRLADGDILVRHDIAHHLGLELGQHIELHGEDGSVEARIGALAANGAPPFAEVVVPESVAAALGPPTNSALIVAVDDEHAPETVAASLEELGEVERHRRPAPEQTSSQPTRGPVEIEPFTYTSRGDSTIAIHGDWVARNIVSADIPNMGTARCHRAMIPQLYAALQQVIDEGLYDHLEPEQYGGCFSPRHIMFNPGRGLSMHAWGLAIDFNVQDNWYGEEPQMHPRIVEIFERWGFEWGGHWSTPDGMHFEVERFVQVD